MENVMETTRILYSVRKGLDRDYVGIMEKKRVTSISGFGFRVRLKISGLRL